MWWSVGNLRFDVCGSYRNAPVVDGEGNENRSALLVHRHSSFLEDRIMRPNICASPAKMKTLRTLKLGIDFEYVLNLRK